MGYDLGIKGWMSETELKRIVEICDRFVPEGGLVVEVGVAQGRSLYAWASSTDPTTKVIALDTWDNMLFEPFIHRVASRAEIWNKVIPLKMKSPPGVWHYPPADVIFIDAEHRNPDFHKDMQFWMTKVKKGGVLCGHDYNEGIGPAFDLGYFHRPDIVPEVNEVCRMRKTELIFKDICTPPITPQHVDNHELPQTMNSIWAFHVW